MPPPPVAMSRMTSSFLASWVELTRSQVLGRLVDHVDPAIDPDLFVFMDCGKRHCSTQIEDAVLDLRLGSVGTRRRPFVPLDDVAGVSKYVVAHEPRLKRLATVFPCPCA